VLETELLGGGSMFPIVFIVLVGFVGSILTIYEFINSRIGNSPKRSQLLALIFGGATVVMIIGSLLFGNILSPSGNNGSPTLTNVTSTPENKTTPTTGFTPIPTSSPTQLSQIPVTPTPTVQSMLPYIADWSHGPNGWPVTDIWRVYGNALHCSGAGDISFPFQLEPGQSGTTDYTVEWKATAQGGDYGITVRAGNDGSDYGYHISFNNSDINQVTWLYIFKGGGHIYGDIQKQYTVPSGSHDYIVTVKANIITIKVDGAIILTREDNTFVTGGSTSFISGGTQVDITYVKVTQA
jgi:hypothetical protein